MDWTMVNNAEGPLHRVQTIIYVFRIRYQCDPVTAATRLVKEAPENELRDEIMRNMRTELATPSGDLGMGTSFDDADSRTYLSDLISTYDQLLRSENDD